MLTCTVFGARGGGGGYADLHQTNWGRVVVRECRPVQGLGGGERMLTCTEKKKERKGWGWGAGRILTRTGFAGLLEGERMLTCTRLVGVGGREREIEC